MQQQLKKYSITFGKNREKIIEENQKIISENNLELIEDFEYNDYFSSGTVGAIKEYFLTTFGFKYPQCKCELSVYRKENDKYIILSNSDDYLLRKFKVDHLYLIKAKIRCDCEFKKYFDYMTVEKFSLIKKLKILEETELQKEIKLLKNENMLLKKSINKLSKEDEIKERKNKKIEDFYDIIININSIKNVSKEGWEVKFTDDGLEKYNKYKDQELITIGVLGNNNKGKSFLLSKISKIKLLTGTSIHTNGLSVKYPELKDYKGRQLILLDSAGFETPVFKKINNEINIKEKANNSNEEQNKVIEKEKDCISLSDFRRCGLSYG